MSAPSTRVPALGRLMVRLAPGAGIDPGGHALLRRDSIHTAQLRRRGTEWVRPGTLSDNLTR